MPNPLSTYGLSDLDYAMTVGMTMGEAMHEGLIGMAAIVATGLNRAQNPGAYLSRSAALGDVFAAPHTASDLVEGRKTPGASGGRQFSPTINSNIPGASTAGHENFKAGLNAALKSALDGTFAPQLGIRQDSFERAKVATEVTVKAREMGIDLGFGVEHFSAPGFERQAGVGRNHSKLGGHSLSPTGGYAKGVQAPTEGEFASRFAAAAAMTGVAIPDHMLGDITDVVDMGQIMASASTLQRQAQDYMTQKMGQQVFPGIDYNDVVQRTNLGAVDVPNLTDKLGITPDAFGFATNFGITPDNDYEQVSLPDPIGRVDRLDDLPTVGALNGDDFNAIQATGYPEASFNLGAYGPDQGLNISSIGPVGFAEFAGITPNGFTGPMTADTFDAIQDQGFPAPAPMSAGTFDAIQSAGFPEPSMSMGYGPEQAFGVAPVGALGMGTAFGVESSPFAPSGYVAGVNEVSPTPDFNAPSLPEREQQALSDYRQDQFERGNWAQPQSLDIDRLNDSLMAELGVSMPTTPTQVASTAPIAPSTSFDLKEFASPIPPDLERTVRESVSPKATPSFDMQAAYLGDYEDKFGPRATPATSVMPQSVPAPGVARTNPVAPAPVQSVQAPRVSPQPVDLPTFSLPATAPMPPSRPDGVQTAPSGSYQGFGTINDAMGAIGAGLASLPSGMNEAWGRTAYSDSPYAGAAWNDVMDRVAKDAGFAERKDVLESMPNSVKGAAMGFPGGPLGMVAGAAFGGLKDMGLNLNPFSGFGDFLGNLFGSGGYEGPYQGAGRQGETYSSERGFTDPGGWGLSLAGDLSGFMDGSAYSGFSGPGGSYGGSTGDGSYGDRAGQNDNNPQGIL